MRKAGYLNTANFFHTISLFLITTRRPHKFFSRWIREPPKRADGHGARRHPRRINRQSVPKNCRTILPMFRILSCKRLSRARRALGHSGSCPASCDFCGCGNCRYLARVFGAAIRNGSDVFGRRKILRERVHGAGNPLFRPFVRSAPKSFIAKRVIWRRLRECSLNDCL